MVALAEWINGTTGFALCLFGAVLNGVTSAFGEVIMLGYLKNFPSHLVGAWSSGTGCAGVFGAGIYLALKGGGLGMILVIRIYVIYYVDIFMRLSCIYFVFLRFLLC